MNSQFTHFGELYRYLENQPSREDFLHHRLDDGYKNLTFAPKPKHFLRNILQYSDDVY